MVVQTGLQIKLVTFKLKLNFMFLFLKKKVMYLNQPSTKGNDRQLKEIKHQTNLL